jgi:hypothetical protein
MIPSDHFVRFYNEVFKALHERGREHLVAYWRELGRLQSEELAQDFREGGLQACYDYWMRILEEENCEGDLTLTDQYFEFRMKKCPSLSKALDNDAGAFELYCDHCMAWVQPTIEAAGMHPAYDMESRTEPHCVFRVYKDPGKAEEFHAQAKLPADPYRRHSED